MELTIYIFVLFAILMSISIILSLVTITYNNIKLKNKYKGLKEQYIKIHYYSDGEPDTSDGLYRKLESDLNLENISTYTLITSSVCFTSGTRRCGVTYNSEKYKGGNMTSLEFLGQVIPFITKAYVDEKYTYVIFVGEGLIFEPLHLRRSEYDEYTYLLRNQYIDKAVKSAFLKMSPYEYHNLSAAYKNMNHLEGCDE